MFQPPTPPATAGFVVNTSNTIHNLDLVPSNTLVSLKTTAIAWPRDPRMTREELLRALHIDAKSTKEKNVAQDDLSTLRWFIIDAELVANDILRLQGRKTVNEV
jgi:uncharacterized protein (UPF0371 family)